MGKKGILGLFVLLSILIGVLGVVSAGDIEITIYMEGEIVSPEPGYVSGDVNITWVNVGNASLKYQNGLCNGSLNGTELIGLVDSPNGSYEWNTTVEDGPYCIKLTWDVDVLDNVSVIVDNTAPTVVLTDNHSDNIVRDADIILITANFTETLSGIDETNVPKITISGLVTDANMTKLNNLVWTYNWDVPAGFNGDVDVSITAKDNAGNSNEPATGKTSYTIDNIIPYLEDITITKASYNGTYHFISPNNDGIYDNISIDLRYSEEVSASIYVINSTGHIIKNLYSSSSVTDPHAKIWNGTDDLGSIVPIGVYTVSTTITDLADNTNTTSVASVYVDNSGPNFSLLSKTPSTSYNDDNVIINATITDTLSNVSSVWISGNWTGTWINYSVTSSNEDYTYLILSGNFSNQEVVGYRWFANDVLGNLASSSLLSFQVKNRAPMFNSSNPIENLSGMEDIFSATINLSEHFYDLDYDNLDYTAIVVSNPGPTSNLLGGVTVDIDNDTGIATISSTSDWNGDGTIVFYAWDFVGDYGMSNTVQVTVIADENDAPTLTSNISPVNFSEDTILDLQLSCNDPDLDPCLNYRYDPDYINYNKSLIVNVNSGTGAVTLTTELDWYGVTYVKFEVDDNGVPLQTGSLVMKVNVTPVNDNPLLNAPDITMKENDPAPSPINLLSYTTDVDNNVLTEMAYNLVSQSNDTLISCSLNTNVINCGAPTPNSYGISELIVEVEDGSGGLDTQKITVNVEPDRAPVITSYSPTYNPIIRENPQEFSIVVEDIDDPILTYVWSVGGTVKTGETTDTYTYTPTIDGEFIVNVTVNDSQSTVSREWTLTVSKYPVVNTFTSTTNFSEIDLGSAIGFFLENDYGKIEFLDTLNLSDVFDLDSTVKIEEGIFAIDTSVYPQLNKPARITLTGLTYNSVPEIFYTEQFTTNLNYIDDACDFCEIISYTNFPTTDGIVVFEVEHFSSFVVVGSGIKYNLSEFEDLEMCIEGEQGDLIVEIEEPSNKDDFGPGDEIEIEVKVKNNGDEDKKIIVEAYLYNADEDEEVEDVKSEYEEIRDGRSETFDLIIIVPDDFEEDDNYILFAKAYEKSDEEVQCNYDAIEVELEREKHKLIISEVSVDSSQSYAGGSLELFVEINNIGGEDEEDVYITVKQSDLGISEKSELFEIEQYGDDDSVTEKFEINVPTTALPREYNFTIEVVYDDGEDSKLVTVSLITRTVFTPVEKLDVIKLTKSETVISLDVKPVSKISVDKKAIFEPENILVTLLVILIIGIIIELIAIAIIRRLRKS